MFLLLRISLLIFLFITFLSKACYAFGIEKKVTIESSLQCVVNLTACNNCKPNSPFLLDLFDLKSGLVDSELTALYATGVILNKLSLAPNSKKVFVLTNYHVAKGGNVLYLNKIKEKYQSNTSLFEHSRDLSRYNRFLGILEFTDEEHDLALLSFDLPKYITSKCNTSLYSETPKKITKLLENLYIPGNTLGIGISVNRGNISAIQHFDQQIFYQINSNLQYGNSGSPVFNSKGNILGLIKSIIENEHHTLSISFAIPHFRIQDFLNNFQKILLMEKIIFSTSTLDWTNLHILESRSKFFKNLDKIVAINDMKISTLENFRLKLLTIILNSNLQIPLTFSVLREGKIVNLPILLSEVE